jgi:hypothetical protein
MARDVDALERASAAFEREHGDEARRRWLQLGAATQGELTEQQLAVIGRGATPEVWDALTWEVSRRIDLLQQARRELDRELQG